ncbi:NAD-dependent protein deacetylase sirtuin-2-like [Ornithodoros turicata]|uniref:NAD-dependent protein deacetylase sirtuin-2-like n=1 Tax=Ornithodoros turicata TaxID=34597 RepID=UPI00313923D6
MDKKDKLQDAAELAKLLPESATSSSGNSERDTSTNTAVLTTTSVASSSATSQGPSSNRVSLDETPQSSKFQNQQPDADDAEEGGDLLSNLSQYLSRKLGFATEDGPVHVLDEPTVDGIIRYMQGGKCRNIIAMIGAGISTAAGIPDFRSPSSGIYSKLGKYNLPSPESIFEINYFRRNPAPFFALAKQLLPQDLKPTLSHFFLRLLHEKGLLLRLYTQNIDSLERMAGVPAEKLVEAHGTFHTSHCLDPECNTEYSLQWLREKIATEAVPVCPHCNTPVKPDIVFFGERLPERFFQLADEDFAKCDLLLIIGTSLQVQPFAGLVDRVHNSIPRLLINLEKCGQGNLMSKIFGFSCGLDFDSEANYRDVALLGTCDDGCRQIAQLLGWKEELEKLVAQYQSDMKAEADAIAAAAAAAEATRIAEERAKAAKEAAQKPSSGSNAGTPGDATDKKEQKKTVTSPDAQK